MYIQFSMYTHDIFCLYTNVFYCRFVKFVFFDLGIEAEAVMLGQSISMLLPEVIGYKVCMMVYNLFV